ncbi:MAG: DUF3761 domain-containing protein [Ilumatobacteraceae bacterium]
MLRGAGLTRGGVAAGSPANVSALSCRSGYYQNSSHNCVRRPVKTKTPSWPARSSARCRDGSYSFSQHRSGTCSHHGGVAAWR